MNIESFLEKLNSNPESISFADTMSVIDENYEFTTTEFNNGGLTNAANENNGSCKIFSFAQIQQFPETLTLHCFGDYYRKDVLEHPDENDHQNIRNFIKEGWAGIIFTSPALKLK